MDESLREAIQRLLNSLGDGWTVTQYVVAMGLERMDSEGAVEATAWYWAPSEQPDWQTSGLLDEAKEMHLEACQPDF